MRKAFCFAAIVILILSLVCTTALADDSFKPSHATPGQTTLATIVTMVAAALFIAAFVLLRRREKSRLFAEKDRLWPMLLALCVLAVGLRVVVALTYEGYATDIACFKGWSTAAFELGPSGFYTTDMFADYPPGYMYILYVLGWLRQVFAIEAGGAVFTLLVKLPSIIAEVVTAVIIYRIGKKQIGGMFGLMCAALILFNPAMFFNSSVWGQIDAVFILFMALTLLYLKKENFLLGALFFTFGLLIKPQAIMFAPVVGLAYVYALFKRGGMKKALVGIFGGAAVFAAVIALGVWPFTGSQHPLWIIDKYAGTVNYYQYTSLNAFNLFALIGGNFADANQPFLFLDYTTWGWIFIGVVCAAVVILQWRSRERRPMFELGAFLILSVFMLAHAMHERYILPVGVLLTFAYVFSRDKAALLFAAAFSLTGLAGQMVTLYAEGVNVAPTPTTILSLINLALYIIYAAVTIKKLSSKKVLIKSPAMHDK